ncbi:MAG TPA: bifunctional phosphopantothenoylcysteine decarboxylase/phosphopantothenate--cysteine ligase CoaBC [Chloroflexi bacterium]|nr:bifunctional phosphopantothenoylcysteine decarboxylase/phosphopantothenate--cysteine ligase CoaBC [Chloroflexota bacterium]
MSQHTVLAGKRVVLGVTGSIAAYKAATLASRLTQMGALVDVIMTEAATRFVTPLTFQSLTGRAVYASLWENAHGGGGGPDDLGSHIAHVGLAERADLLLLAPATANTIAKIALGLADDLLSVTALAARCPIIMAPAMDAGMYENPVTQAHVETLRVRGVHFAGPVVGRMASGLEGMGRMVEPDEIIGHCRYVLGRNGPLHGRRVVVTAGPTREPLDPVRFISNHSTGKQGFAIAQAAVDAGADVTLISGPVALSAPVGVHRVDVTDADSMRAAVLAHATRGNQADALIMSAAVADFRPLRESDEKIKKAEETKRRRPAPFTLELVQTPDILLEVTQQVARPRVTIGFAAESEDLIENARAKLEQKRLDLIVANDITAEDAGFEADTNRVHFITAEGAEALPLMSKEEVGVRLVEWLVERLAEER